MVSENSRNWQGHYLKEKKTKTLGIEIQNHTKDTCKKFSSNKKTLKSMIIVSHENKKKRG